MRTRQTLPALLGTSLTTALLLVAPLGDTAMAAQDPSDGVEVHSRDVFVIVGSTLRNPTADTAADAPLYTNAGVPIETSPTDPVTWGEWSSASATSTAHTLGGRGRPRTDVRLELGGLIPGGVYSVFWGTLQPDSEQPLCPGVERTLPLDALHPEGDAPNSFVVGPTGTVDFRGRVDGALLDASQVFFTVVYHAFGETSYPFPNVGELRTQGENCRSSFGEDSMRHLLILQQW
ncbi:MAG: hypothetical protein ABR540_02915 [Acidimicrobiales bacterium]